MNYGERQRARLLVDETCVKTGHPELVGQIKIEWNDRFTRRMGDASYRNMTVRFSLPLWPHASEEARTQTIVHEACHIIARHEFGRGIQAHGCEWRKVMARAGYLNAERCHSVDRSAVVHRHEWKCSCQTYQIGKQIHRKMLAGQRRYCRKCKTYLVQPHETPERGDARQKLVRQKSPFETIFSFEHVERKFADAAQTEQKSSTQSGSALTSALELRRQGHGWSVIARKLNAIGFRMDSGKEYYAQVVRSMVLRAGGS